MSFDAATEVNFTLTKSPVEKWSKDQDFSIKNNIAESYLSNHELDDELTALSVRHNQVMEYKIMSKTDEGFIVPLVHLSMNLTNQKQDKPHVLLIGGLHGDEPIGGEILVRFIRHILGGEFDSLPPGKFLCFFCLLIFFKINFFEKFFQEYHESFKQFGYRSGMAFCLV